MARKIAVEGETVHYKPSVARRLIRRGWADWVREGFMIRRRITRRPPEPITAKPAPPYIPKDLPPVELPGLKFTLPEGVPSQVVFLSKAARVFAENAARA